MIGVIYCRRCEKMITLSSSVEVLELIDVHYVGRDHPNYVPGKTVRVCGPCFVLLSDPQ